MTFHIYGKKMSKEFGVYIIPLSFENPSEETDTHKKEDAPQRYGYFANALVTPLNCR